MWRRIREIVRKEMRQSMREPRMLVIMFVPPVMQLLIFGFAVNLDIENASIAWMDRDLTPLSRELRAAFDASPNFHIKEEIANEDDVRRLLDRGLVQAVVRIPAGFEKDVLRGRRPGVQILIEGTNSNTASLLSGYTTQLVAGFSRRLSPGRQPPIEARTRVWFNQDLKSRNYFVPGVLVNIIMLVTLMLTALAIVREKEIGTMEQLMVTPIRPFELMIGKLLPYALVGLVDLVLVTVAALAIFGIPFRGSALLLLGCALLFLMTTLGAGLFISTISQTQQQAMMSSFFFTMPAFFLSGFAFPIHAMPMAVQFLSYLNPVRYFIEIVRGIFLKGTGVETLWPQMTALAVFGAAVLGISSLRFRKRLD
ncbi:MAG: ABC transporter permease [Bryobacteraceae bacterium]